MKTLNVVVGLLFNNAGKVLIAKRLDYDNMWEFPGGKIEKNETPEQALTRELKEEIGVTATQLVHLVDTYYAFPDRKVYLNAFIVNSYQGEPIGAEGQQIKWEGIEQLGAYPFPGANDQIIAALQNEVKSWT